MNNENRYSKSLPAHIKSGFDLLKQHQQTRNTIVNDNTIKNWDIDDIHRVAPTSAPPPAVWVHKNKHIKPNGTKVDLTSPIVIDLKDYRMFHFENTNNSVINVNNKVIKMSFVDCKNLEININSNVFGTLDFIRCKNITVNINARVNTIQIDLCCKITFNQYTQEVMYVGTTCMDTIVNFKDDIDMDGIHGTTKFILPITMFADQTYCIVNDDGIQSHIFARPLNHDPIFGSNINQHVMFK